MSWVKERQAGPGGINIVIIDFADSFNFIPAVIQLNDTIPTDADQSDSIPSVSDSTLGTGATSHSEPSGNPAAATETGNGDVASPISVEIGGLRIDDSLSSPGSSNTASPGTSSGPSADDRMD